MQAISMWGIVIFVASLLLHAAYKKGIFLFLCSLGMDIAVGAILDSMFYFT